MGHIIPKIPFNRAIIWVFFAFLYLPMVVLVVYSFNGARVVTVIEEFSLRWYAKALENPFIIKASINSLIVAGIAAPASVVIAVMAALVMVRGRRFIGKSAVNGLLMMPLVVPEIVTAVASLIFFSAMQLKLGLGNIIIAHIVFCIPFAYMPIKASLEAMDPNLEVAAQDLYSNEWTAFRLITLPLLLPGIVSGLMLAFVISLDDFIITLMIAGPGDTTLPVYIYSMIRTGVTPEVNAISTILLIFSMILISFYWIFTKKSDNNNPAIH